MRPASALFGFLITVAASATAVGQYSKEIHSRPTANATLGPYNTGMLRRSGFDVGFTSRSGNGSSTSHAHSHQHRHFHRGRSGVSLSVNVPFYGYDYGYTSVYGFGAPLIYGHGYPYGVAYPYGYGYTWPYYVDTGAGPLGPFVAPPLHVPAEQLGFGPQAVRRFMGINANRPVTNRNIVVVPPAAVANGNNIVVGKRPVRVSNAEARARARRFIELGDAQFDAGKLAQAYDRYKKAGEAAPDLAEPYFRQGHMLAAMARYDQAGTAFRRGLNLEADWPAKGFRLERIYRDNHAAREAMLDAVQQAAAAQVEDVNVQFVAGVQFFFDGQQEKARTFFERAKELGEAAAFTEPFLKLLAAPAPAPEVELDL
jgi:hypothetical protein